MGAAALFCIYFLHRLSGGHERRQRVRPFRAESFAVNHDGECRYARRAHKRVDNLRFSTLL